jgi:hypothetical protein
MTPEIAMSLASPGYSYIIAIEDDHSHASGCSRSRQAPASGS